MFYDDEDDMEADIVKYSTKILYCNNGKILYIPRNFGKENCNNGKRCRPNIQRKYYYRFNKENQCGYVYRNLL